MPSVTKAALLAATLASGALAQGNFLQSLGRSVLGDEMLFVLGDLGAEQRVGASVLSSHLGEQKQKLSSDAAKVAWVEGIFAKLAAVAPKHSYDLKVHVLEDPTVNAYALPGGGIFVYDGMLDLAVSDDEVACVLGHEIGHVLRRHGMKRMRRDVVMKGAIQALVKNATAAQLAQVGATFKGMSFSRQDEDESDALGMQLALDAGFDPSGAVTLWTRMQERSGGGGGGIDGFLSTHPSNQARINNTRAWLTRRGLPFHVTEGKSYQAGAVAKPVAATTAAPARAAPATAPAPEPEAETRIQGLRSRLKRLLR